MCQRSPCLGTPHDILALIEAGYLDQVCPTLWAAGMVLGYITRPIVMVQIKSKGKGKDGECVFFHDGKCDLHESDILIIEGIKIDRRYIVTWNPKKYSFYIGNSPIIAYLDRIGNKIEWYRVCGNIHDNPNMIE